MLIFIFSIGWIGYSYAQDTLHCDYFDFWTVGTAFYVNPEDTSEYAFADFFTPYIYNDNIGEWTHQTDPDFESLVFDAANPYFGLNGGIYPDGLTEFRLAINLQTILSIAGADLKVFNYDFEKPGKISFKYEHEVNALADTVWFEFRSSIDSFIYEMVNIDDVSPEVEDSIEIPLLNYSSQGDTLKISILKKSDVPNNSIFYLDDLCLIQYEPIISSVVEKEFQNCPEIAYGINGELILQNFPTKDSSEEIIIFDAFGRIVYERFLNRLDDLVSIPTSHLLNGIYIVHYKAGNDIYSLKYIKR